MSGERGDCEHGHAAAVAEIASMIASDHGLTMASCVLVIVGPTGTLPTVIGRYNTAALATAADGVLTECARHEPDGCEMCDPAARAAAVARDVLRTEFARQQQVHRAKRRSR